MKIRKLHKVIRRIALGLAVVAIAAPAQADPSFNESGSQGVPQTYGVGATLQDYLESKGLPASAQYTYGVGATLQDYLESTVVRPDDRGVRLSPISTPETIIRPADLPCVPNCAEGLLPTAVSPDTVAVRPAPADNVRPVSTPEAAVRSDDRPSLGGPGAAPAQQPGEVVSYRNRGRFVTPATPEAVPAITLSPGRFDWTDAGIGAGFALGLMLLASGAALVARRTRQTSAAAF